MARERRDAKEKAARERRDADAETAREEHARNTAPTIAFSVHELTGKKVSITTLSALHTVDQLKQVLATSCGAQVEQVQLVLQNKLLADGKQKLGDCGVCAGSKLNMTTKAIAEAVPPSQP